MEDQTEKIPPFVQDYLTKIDHEGYADFVKLYREYKKEREDYPGKYAIQAAHLKDFNRTTGQNRQLNYEDGLKRIDADFRKKAYDTAKKHGYTGHDPNQPADKEFTRQGEKFQDMIDQARQRQPEQPEQKQEAAPGQEKNNIDTIKEQQSYQQNPAKVEFKGMEQPSGTEQQNREQQRAAFLEKVKATREQQAQRQQDKQPEI